MARNPDIPPGASLYHGTLRKHVEAIISGGLRPSVGPFTRSYYRHLDLVPLVIAADLDNIGSCHSAIGGAIREEFGAIEPKPFSASAIHKYGAMVRICERTSGMCWRPDDGVWDEEKSRRFAQVEPGNYFSTQAVPILEVLVGDELIYFMNEHLHNSLM